MPGFWLHHMRFHLPLHLALAAWFLSLFGSPAFVVAQSAEANRRIDGYRGVWFTLGQYYGPGADGAAYGPASKQPLFPYGDKYSGGLGTYTAKHTPVAVYCEDVDKTFFVYGGTTGPRERHLLCMIGCYDHRTGRAPRPVVVHDKQGVDDPHDKPQSSDR